MPAPELFDGATDYYATLFHELVHSTGHRSRLARFEDDQFEKRERYAREELVAEIGSAMICLYLGISTDALVTNSAAYVQNWMEAIKEDEHMILTAAGKAEAAFEMIAKLKEATDGSTASEDGASIQSGQRS